jgi:hypothetical protein
MKEVLRGVLWIVQSIVTSMNRAFAGIKAAGILAAMYLLTGLLLKCTAMDSYK